MRRSTHDSWRKLAGGFEPLEKRDLMSAEGLSYQGLYDAGSAYIAPVWFEQLSTSSSQQSSLGLAAENASVGKVEWKNVSIDAYLDEWIVQLQRSAADQITSLSQVASLFAPASFGVEIIGGLGMEGQLLVRTTGASTQSVSDWFKAQTDLLAYFEPNAVLPLSQTPDDTNYSQLWGMNNTGQTGGRADADIDAPEAWDITTGSSRIVVGLIDTGVDYNHPDLAANIWTNPGEIAGNGIDDDHDGFVDDVHGFDFVNNDGDPMDDNGHGTHCAGTIAGCGDNGQGVVGVSWNSQVMVLKFLGANGSGSISDAVRAINYATMMRTRYGVDVRVLSNSWGGGGYSQSMYDAIEASNQAGMLFVAAAGNDSANCDAAAHYPSGYSNANVIAVAATDQNDNLASFSNYGATSVDLAAPGVNIYSTKPGGGYQYMSGTSMATPHVSGAAALLWSAYPTATVSEIRAALLGGVDQLASLSGKVASGGRLNVRGALDQLGLHVIGSSPAEGASVSTRLTSFTVDFSRNIDATTVQAADFTVNGLAANSFTVVDANTVTFRFNSSPVATQGPQTMRIAEGAIGVAGGGESVHVWQSTFYYDQTPLCVTAATPAEGQTLNALPSTITLVFNEALSASSLAASDLVLSAGTVTGVTLVNANTVRFNVNLNGVEGPVTYSLAAGAVSDGYGDPGAAYVGHFTIDDPTVNRYVAGGGAIADLSTRTFTLTVSNSGVIDDLDVELDITHTYDQDLSAYLIAPDGTRIALFSGIGGSGDNFTNTVLDDEASQSITAAAAPFSGSFRPSSALAQLDGKNANGTWKLEISDNYQYDVGTLNSWALRITSNHAPTLDAIADCTMSHMTDAINVPIVARDADGQALTVTVQTTTAAYEVDRAFGLYAEPSRVAANYYYNTYGLREKWIKATDGYGYYVLPDGSLNRFLRRDGNRIVGERVATVGTQCWANPALLSDAAVPGSIPVQLSYNAQNGVLTINPASTYAGEFDVKVSVSDGRASTWRMFHVTVTNATPTLAAIADQTMSPSLDQLSFQAHASDADGDALTYSVTATGTVHSDALDLDTQLGLYADTTRVANNYYYNTYGMGEKWLPGANGMGYYLLPDGTLNRIVGRNGSTIIGQYVGTPGVNCWSNPQLLWDAQPQTTAVGVSVSSTGLVTIDPPQGFVGDVTGTVRVSDGVTSSSRTFRVSVVNTPPTMDAIADQSMSSTQGTLSFQTNVTNADGDPLTYSVSATGTVNAAAVQIDAQFGLTADSTRVANNYYYNSYGMGEKWLPGANGIGYYLLPDGTLNRMIGRNGSTILGQYVATPGVTYWSNPQLLWDAQPQTVAVAASVSNGGLVTIHAPQGFVGDVTGSVTVSDGVSIATRSFRVRVADVDTFASSSIEAATAPAPQASVGAANTIAKDATVLAEAANRATAIDAAFAQLERETQAHVSAIESLCATMVGSRSSTAAAADRFHASPFSASLATDRAESFLAELRYSARNVSHGSVPRSLLLN